jgi:hypothetical protein
MQEHGAPSWDRQQGFHRVSEPAAILRVCARERVATTVQFGHTDAYGHFTRLRADGIEIELDAPVSEDGPTIQGWCGVLFHHAGRACMLMGAVERGSSPRSLKMRRPFSMQIQRRANPRVAVAHDGGMAVRVGCGEVWWHPKPVDLSRTGIGLAFHGANTPDWSVGKIVWVDLVHRLDAVSVKALVVRKDGQNYGFAFVPVSGAQQYEMNVRMDRILHDLARPDAEVQNVA